MDIIAIDEADRRPIGRGSGWVGNPATAGGKRPGTQTACTLGTTSATHHEFLPHDPITWLTLPKSGTSVLIVSSYKFVQCFTIYLSIISG